MEQSAADRATSTLGRARGAPGPAGSATNRCIVDWSQSILVRIRTFSRDNELAAVVRISEDLARVVTSARMADMSADRTRTHPNEAAFPKGLSGPALRALANAGIGSMAEVARWSDADLVALHGFGPRGLRVVRDALHATAGAGGRP